MATRGGHFDLVKTCLKMGMGSNDQTEEGLREALERGHCDTVELLLDEETDSVTLTTQIPSLILRAAAGGNLAMANVFLAKQEVNPTAKRGTWVCSLEWEG